MCTFIYVNEEGLYLVVSKISSHSSKNTYTFGFTSDINKAFVTTGLSAINRMHWKHESPVNYLCNQLRAEEIKKVVLIRDL